MFMIAFFLPLVATLPPTIKIGGLFETSDEIQEIAFKYAAEIINNRPDILPDTNLTTQLEKVPRYNTFEVAKTVCNLISDGALGIFGPKSDDTTDHVQSICDTMEIPHVEVRWDIHQRRGSCSVNLYPHPSVLSKAYADIVRAWNWKSFTVLYDDNEGLIRMSDLIKFYDYKGYGVTVRQLDEGDNYRPTLQRIKHSGEKYIVLDCPIEKLYDVLIQAQQVGLMGGGYNYIITSLDLHTIDMDPFKYGGTNLTGIRLFDPYDPEINATLQTWINRELEANTFDSDILEYLTPENLQAETLLLHDAVHLFASAIDHADKSLVIEMPRKPLSCKTDDHWEHGYTIINYMKVSEMNGLTGLIKFNHEGFRTDIKLDIVELTIEGLQKKGTWNSTDGVNLTLLMGDKEPELQNLHNMTFIVLIALTHPYGMLKEASSKLSGNDRFEGFGIDLIHELSLMSGFNYTFHVQADKSSGNPDKNGKWNGMIGEVLAGRADLAIADITITRERERDADFTMPFMNLGISILFKKPTKMPPSLFSFLSPFTNEVWGYMMAAYLGVSFLLFVMARISPSEWTNPYPCIEEPENLENQFSVNNSLWFTLGSIMQQGSEIAPIAVSTRLTAGIWWFFTLIMVSSYTANLAAFLTIETPFHAFRNVEELANQKNVKYGAKLGGSTVNFFRDSNISTYQKMWQFMQENPDCLTPNNDIGVERVEKENYAFLMESTSIEYEVERRCELTQVGNLLDNKGYGIVMRKNMWYRNALSSNVLKLQEKGKIIQLKNKWWKEKRGGGACTDTSDAGEASELTLENVGGVFLVLVVGVFFACFITMFELLWDIYSREDKVSFKQELMKEIKFIIRCQGRVKPIKKMKEETEEENNSEENDGLFSLPFNGFTSDSKN